VTFLVSSLTGLGIRNKACNILVLRCLNYLEPNIVVIMPFKFTLKLKFSFGIMP
jgi:hypothetical protein